MIKWHRIDYEFAEGVGLISRSKMLALIADDKAVPNIVAEDDEGKRIMDACGNSVFQGTPD